MHGACLAELVSYSCSRSLDQSKSCPYIFDPDCSFVDEECAELAEDKKTCLKKKINYACLKKVTKQIKKPRLIIKGVKVQPSSLKCGALCLDGSCIAQQKRKLNDDKQFNQAIAGLAGLKKIADTVNSTGKTVNIFGGREMSCDIKMALGDHCGAEAKNLADLKERGQCVKIGSYCKSKILGFCAIKRNKFCCFDSVVTKVFNQEGKKQLKRNNGTAKRANCQGFDIKELDAVDFRRADLKEVYEVLLNDIELPEVNMMKNNVIQNVEQGNNNNNDNQYFDEGR
jgi:conjugal transfer mating pair stabilization protein TraN